MVDLVCKSTGGPCVYTGRDMKTAHAGAGITKADWDHSLKIFGEVLNKFKVPEKEQQELAALLAALEKDVVDKTMSVHAGKVYAVEELCPKWPAR